MKLFWIVLASGCVIAIALLSVPTARFISRMSQPIDNPITLSEEIDGKTVVTETYCSRVSPDVRAFCAITQLYGDASSKQLTALPPNSPTGPAQVPGR